MSPLHTQQSFVPKKPINEQRKIGKGSMGLFFGLSLLVFILATGSTASVYAYELYMSKKVENMRVSLERAKDAFEPSLIIELKKLDARIRSAGEILDNHIALSELFEMLEMETLETVRFKSFRYSARDDDISINLTGKAKSYSSVVLQSDVFGENKFIKNPIFSGLNLDAEGNVDFRVSAEIDPKLLSYKESLNKK